jgi:hypothetical protein
MGDGPLEDEFEYSPHLDASRDKDLLDILPDYLTEEITFPRSGLVRFFAKLMDYMTKNVIIED